MIYLEGVTIVKYKEPVPFFFKYYAFEAKTVERILKARFCPRQLEFISARSVSQSLSLLPEVKQRPLEEYSALFKESSHG